MFMVLYYYYLVKNHRIFMTFYTQQHILNCRDERQMIKNKKVALDRLRVRHNVFLVLI